MVIGTPTVLNLIPGGVMKVIHVNQVNENIEIQFRIMNGAQPFNVPEGVSCTIRGTKGDNFGYAAAVAVTAGSNIVTVTLTEQLTAVAGAGNIFELVFVGASDDMKVSTENFILAVERAALGEDTVISDSDLAYADQVLDQLQSVGAVNAQVQQNTANIAAETTRATAAEAAEASARQAADQTLQQNINAEAAARQAADNTLQSNINAEASSRATTDASLQAQIDQLIAPSGSAPSAAEVENARIGSDGTVYPTLGDAIRTQNSDLKSHIQYGYINASDYVSGQHNQNLALIANTARCTTRNFYFLGVGDAIEITDIPSGYKAAVDGAKDGAYVFNSGWTNNDYKYTVEANKAGYYYVLFAKNNGTDEISPSDITASVKVIWKCKANENADRITDIENILDETVEIDHTNLCPNPTVSTTASGYLNASSGVFGHVTSGTTYTFSATDQTGVTKNILLRVSDGSNWYGQAEVNTQPNQRFSVTFTANYTGDISLSANIGAYHSPALTEIQLEEGDTATDYVPHDRPVAVDAIARNEIRSVTETITKNLSQIDTMKATGGGNINASCGVIAHVEANTQYTLSFYNDTARTNNLDVRVIADGTTTQTGIVLKNLTANGRFFVAFVSPLTGNLVLNTALGSENASRVVFTEIQLEEGNVPTWYAEPNEITARDIVARESIKDINNVLDFTAFESGIKSVAHQGGNIYGYPQNTLPNFIACAKNRWKNVEFDVRWTSDRVPVISHDDGRTLYGTSTTVQISETTYSNLQTMQFFADATIKIPSFYEAIDVCKLYGLNPFVEIKADATTAEIEDLITYLKRKKLFGEAFITSFQIGVVTPIVQSHSEANVLLNIQSTDTLAELIASDSRYNTLLNHTGKTVFAFSTSVLSSIADLSTHLGEFSDAGAYICAYTLNTTEQIEQYAKYADYVTSDSLQIGDVY